MGVEMMSCVATISALRLGLLGRLLPSRMINVIRVRRIQKEILVYNQLGRKVTSRRRSLDGESSDRK